MNQFRLRNTFENGKPAGLAIDDAWRLIEAFGNDDAKELAAEIRIGLEELNTRKAELEAEARQVRMDRIALDSRERELADKERHIEFMTGALNDDRAHWEQRKELLAQKEAALDAIRSDQWTEDAARFDAFLADLDASEKACAA